MSRKYDPMTDGHAVALIGVLCVLAWFVLNWLVPNWEYK